MTWSKVLIKKQKLILSSSLEKVGGNQAIGKENKTFKR